MQKNDPLSVDENVEIKGQKIISNSSLTIANYVLHLYLGLKWSAVHFGSHIGGIVFCGRILDALVVHDGHETNFFAQTKLKICE